MRGHRQGDAGATFASAGLALMPSIVGQTFSVPLTITLPVRGASWHASGTWTDAVWPALTLKVLEPPQLSEPSVVIAVIVMLKPMPTGNPPMVAVSVFDCDTLIVPLFMNLFGPVIE